jgi:polysaccharide biosynthesis protein PslL
MLTRTSRTQGRVELIDIAKGISIILVAFGHSHLKLQYPAVNHVMTLFRMPLFFFLAGLFFQTHVRPLRYFLHKADALLKPYFAFLIGYSILSALRGKSDLWISLLGIVYSSAGVLRWSQMWFLTHLWLLFTFSYIVSRLLKLDGRHIYFRCAIVGLFLLSGSMTLDTFRLFKISLGSLYPFVTGLPFSADLLLLSSAFFLAGSILRVKVKHFKASTPILLIALTCFIGVLLLGGTTVDLNKRIFAPPLLASVASISGIYLVLALSSLITRSQIAKLALLTCGSASLFILMFHPWVEQVIYAFLTGLPINVHTHLLAVFALICSITLPLIVKKILAMTPIVKLFFFPLEPKAKTPSHPRGLRRGQVASSQLILFHRPDTRDQEKS